MTTETRSLSTPRVEARSFAVGTTARAAHPSALSDLANDAAGGHPAQRMTLRRVVSSGVYHTHWIPTAVPKFLRVTALFTSSAVSFTNGVHVKLDITDGTTTVVYTDPEVPPGLQGDVNHTSGYSTSQPSRLGAGARGTWTLDVDALVTAGLSLTATAWRFIWTLIVTSPGELEHLTIDELPRFAVDDSEDFGQVQGTYLPRGIVRDGSPLGLPRLWETTRVGLMLGLRTYHSLARPEGDPWLVTSTAFGTFGGSDEESAGVPARYIVRPRAMRASTTTRVRYLIRYKITGASPGDTATVRLTTGVTTYDVVLTDVSGSWAESAWTTARLAAAATDELTWLAKVSNGASTLRVIARPVIDYPEA